MARIFHPLLALIASGTDRELAKYVQFLKEENKILRARITPAPDRTSDKWSNFLEHHKNTLWAVDFFSVKAITARGRQNLYCLVFLCMESRANATAIGRHRPTGARGNRGIHPPNCINAGAAAQPDAGNRHG